MFTPRPSLSDSNRDNAWKNVVTKNMNQLMDGSGWIPVGDDLTLSSTTSNPTTYICNCANANQKFQVGDKVRLRQNIIKAKNDISQSSWAAWNASKAGDAIGFTPTAQYGCIYQDIVTEPGTYIVTVQAKVASGTRSGIYLYDENSNTGNKSVSLTTSYQTITATITTTTGSLHLMLRDVNTSGFVTIQCTGWQLAVQKYFYVVGATSSTLTLCAGSDYWIDDSVISNLAYSRAERPWGFPEWFSWSPSVTGFTSAPTGYYRFKICGLEVRCVGHQTAAGTSNSTAFTIPLPVTAANRGDLPWSIPISAVMDNGAWIYTPVVCVYGGGSVGNVYTNGIGSGFTASGNKRLFWAQWNYEIAA